MLIAQIQEGGRLYVTSYVPRCIDRLDRTRGITGETITFADEQRLEAPSFYRRPDFIGVQDGPGAVHAIGILAASTNPPPRPPEG